MNDSLRVVVLGAGAFGGWTALHLLRNGADVTLIDPWGPGNSRSSSGGETRIFRHCYADRINVELAASALQHWKAFQLEQKHKLFVETGALFMVRDPEFEHAARMQLLAAGIEFELLDRASLSRRFPHFSTDACGTVIFEPASGYLMAREACAAVASAFVAEGGKLIIGDARPGRLEQGRMRDVVILDAGPVSGDAFVFACGPWLPGLFPNWLADRITVTRQEVYFFGTPPGLNFATSSLPVWADIGEAFWYGTPDVARRGMKIADDTRGPPFDPTRDDRSPSASGIQAARETLANRIPAMRDAPLIESRVCQYSNTPDGHFLIDRLPDAANAWIAGGGSGHGFKHGPAIGEFVAAAVVGDRELPPEFLLSRFGQGFNR